MHIVKRLKQGQLIQRSISLCFILIIVGFFLFKGGKYLEYGSMTLCCGMILESYFMFSTKYKGIRCFLHLAFFSLYVVVFFLALMQITTTNHWLAEHFLIWLMLIISLSDIGGYIIGTTLGGPKIIPKISPNKTWSGLLGSIALPLLGNYVMGRYTIIISEYSWYTIALIALCGQAGDFLASALKRYVGVKDSSKLIPGHGGLLDRMDSITFVVICTWLGSVIIDILA